MVASLSESQREFRLAGMKHADDCREGMTEFRPIRALVISSSEDNCAALSVVLSSEGLAPMLCSSMVEACALLEHGEISIVFCDDRLPGRCLEKVVAKACEKRNPIPVVAVSRTGEWHEYLEALRIGAFDYLSLPPRRDELDRVLALALSKGRPNNRAKAEAAINEGL